MHADEILAGLDPEQLKVAQAVCGPVCVLAGAGTGKTRAITHRIAYAVATEVVDPTSVLAVTFTTRAAAELRARLRELGAPGVQARTFHAAALRQLVYFWPKVIGGDPPTVIESKVRLLVDAARLVQRRPDRAELRDVASEIEWAKVTQVPPEAYPHEVAKADRVPPFEAVEVAKLYDAYERLRRERNLIDFETILELTAAILSEHVEVAARVRGQYRYFVVDEYQDVNPLQKLLLDQWLGDRDELCVVGDPNQTIYSFTGATPNYLLNFAVEHREAEVVKLIRDYRSTPQVVNLANRVLERARGRAKAHRFELLAQRPDGPEPAFGEYADEAEEAEEVAKRARKLIDDGVPMREIAVLFRINAQSQNFEDAFSAVGIPYQVRGAERFFDRPEVRRAVVLLRGAARSEDESDMRHILQAAGLTDAPPSGGQARERWESLSALAQLSDDYPNISAFVAELERRAAEQHAPALDGVTLASLHAAKGLEWDAVFLAGAVDGTLPIVYADTQDRVEEERRLFYVGITRAREHLAISWALARSPGGRPSRRPSRFLDGLGGVRTAALAVPARASRTAKSGKPAVCRICGKGLADAVDRKLGRCASCPADYDEELLSRLREWRGVRAKQDKVPAYVIFTDATLQAIAESGPASEADLLKIAGIGPVKMNRYGAAVLELIRERGTEGTAGSS